MIKAEDIDEIEISPTEDGGVEVDFEPMQERGGRRFTAILLNKCLLGSLAALLQRSGGV